MREMRVMRGGGWREERDSSLVPKLRLGDARVRSSASCRGAGETWLTGSRASRPYVPKPELGDEERESLGTRNGFARLLSPRATRSGPLDLRLGQAVLLLVVGAVEELG